MQMRSLCAVERAHTHTHTHTASFSTEDRPFPCEVLWKRRITQIINVSLRRLDESRGPADSRVTATDGAHARPGLTDRLNLAEKARVVTACTCQEIKGKMLVLTMLE